MKRDVDLELREQTAKGATWEAARVQLSDQRFYTDAGKQLYAEILTANPNDWHILSPNNRLNGGDWKQTS